MNEQMKVERQHANESNVGEAEERCWSSLSLSLLLRFVWATLLVACAFSMTSACSCWGVVPCGKTCERQTGDLSCCGARKEKKHLNSQRERSSKSMEGQQKKNVHCLLFLGASGVVCLRVFVCVRVRNVSFRGYEGTAAVTRSLMCVKAFARQIGNAPLLSEGNGEPPRKPRGTISALVRCSSVASERS